MLLLSMTMPLFPLAVLAAEPSQRTAWAGRFVPAGPMLLLEMVLLSLPLAVTVSVSKKMTGLGENTDVPEPWRLALVIVLLVAPLTKRIVDVSAVADTMVLAMVSELPPVL